MTIEPTYYDLLGVAPSATQAQIKTAYVMLMKRFHPDSPLRSSDLDSGGQVRAINAAYSVLKDPYKRGRYDLDLRGSSAGYAIIAPGGPVSKGSWRPGAGSVALLLVLGILAGSLVTSVPVDSGSGLLSSPAFAVLSSVERRVDYSQPDPAYVEMTPQLRAAAFAAITARNRQAVEYSARCFARALDDPTAASPDGCVVFDLAYAYWHENDGSSDASSDYFREESVEKRDLAALAGLGAEGSWLRFDALRAATFSMLLQQVRRLSAVEEERRQALENGASDQLAEPSRNAS